MSDLTTFLRGAYNARAFDGFSPVPTFDLGTAGALMWMSQLAYETAHPGKIEDILEDWGLRLVPKGIVSDKIGTVLPMASTRAIVASGRGATILAFAGTDPLLLRNWITNFEFFSDRDGPAEGFRQAVAAFDIVKKRILAQIPADGPVFVTGHSLGGALAVIAAHFLRSKNIDVRGVYTYGMPRPGDKAFANGIYDPALGARTYRLVHGADIVATVAPSEVGSRHVGRLLRCSARERFNPATLSAVPGPDEPHYLANVIDGLRAALKDPVSAARDLLDQAIEVGTIAINRTPAHGRPPDVAVIVETLSPEFRDHLQDSYINALGAGPL
jgi:Lipase (class 3)